MDNIEDLWETGEEEWSTEQESGDILFEDPPVMKLDFNDYE
tara:strand:+ start:2048 stop:2170 length:123 start_codon:yes stop_codon:yes gene_type:complete